MNAFKTTARCAFSLVVFALILYLVDAHGVVETIRTADAASVLIAACTALGAQAIAAIRLRQLLAMQEIALSVRRVFLIGLAATFYGLLIPGGTVASVAARFVQLSRDARVETIAAALVVDRSVAVVFLFVIGALTIAFDKAEPAWVGAMLAGVLCGIGIFAIGRRALVWLTARLDDLASDRSPGRVRRFGARIGRALSNYTAASGAEIRIVLATSLLAHLSGCCAYYAIALGLGFDISFLTICWIRSGVILATMVPVSLAGIGMREISSISLLVPLGFTEAQAVGFSILIFLSTSVLVGLIGGSSELLGATSRR
ncbi:MAG: flippase-like domain-containing protein [Deltaproteobacteria bacterium]|jgi:uncharacterized protein (TIRG00374 family)|nr:flippase-like domain-containing protein [Deltaproteobacteria bacterium]